MKSIVRGLEEKKGLIDFTLEHCEDETVKQWLKENSSSASFLQLVNVFNFLKKEFDKESKKTDCKDIDIIFVAHGSVESSTIPAKCLLPLNTIQDVLLYSPWNCSISAEVAYGIATGVMKPQHRRFICQEEDCQTHKKFYSPGNLPNHWNSLKEAGGQKIPNIMVSTLRKPEDAAWKRIEVLKDEYGHPAKNRVLIPFLLPGTLSDMKVPFSLVTLALSLVLHFSTYKATVHLAACLSKSSLESSFDQVCPKKQYTYISHKTLMTTSETMLPSRHSFLYKVISYVFD